MDAQRRIAELEATIVAKDARIAELELQVATLVAQVAALSKQVADLTAKLGQNSRNSHLPPSSDPPGSGGKPGGAGKPKSERPRGGQRGHPPRDRRRPIAVRGLPERIALLRALHRDHEARELCDDTLRPAIFQWTYLAARRTCTSL